MKNKKTETTEKAEKPKKKLRLSSKNQKIFEKYCLWHLVKITTIGIPVAVLPSLVSDELILELKGIRTKEKFAELHGIKSRTLRYWDKTEEFQKYTQDKETTFLYNQSKHSLLNSYFRKVMMDATAADMKLLWQKFENWAPPSSTDLNFSNDPENPVQQTVIILPSNNRD